MTSILRELARLYAIQLTYEDTSGRRRDASRQSLEAVLKARIPEGAAFGEALRARKDEHESCVVEPVTVLWGRSRPRIPVRTAQTIDWEIQLEDGTTRAGRDEPKGGLLVLPHALPSGYHTMRLNQLAETLLICAPAKAPAPKHRSWGTLLPLFAVRGPGDLSDLQAYREWINELGGGVVATLPLLASFGDEPSPYSPVSRLFWNEMYLDPTRTPEFDPADFAARDKRGVLERMATRFRQDEDFHHFARHGAYGYAHFRAATEDRDSANYHLYVQYRMAQQMREVADDARRTGIGLYLDFPLGVHPAGYDAWKYSTLFAKGVSVGAPPDPFFTKGQNWGFPPLDPDAIRAHRYQYFRDCIRHHVSHAGILRLDHVMGLHRLFWIPDGMEAKDGVYVRYREDEFYAVVTLEAHRHGCAVVGEDLGTVPQYVPQMMTRHGFRRMYVLQYVIPSVSEGSGGLGVAPPMPPDPSLTLGMTLPRPPGESVASVNTHDMPTFAGFWSGADIEDRVGLSLLSAEEARREREKRDQMRRALVAFLKARGLLPGEDDDTKAVLEGVLMFLGGNPAEVVLVNLEDLWLEREPQNVPGVPERSWKRKFRYTLEEIRGNGEIERILRRLDRQRRKVDGDET